MLNKKLLTACVALAAIGQAHGQTAGSLTGQVGVQITIGAGCTVTNGSVAGGANQWGTIDFGTHPDLVNVVDAQVVGASGNIQIQCNDGVTPFLTVNGGLYSSGAQRNMQNTVDGTSQIGYSLYANPARTDAIVPGTAMSIASSATGTAVDIPIYGRVVPTGQASTTPAAGLYTDTLLVTLAW
jgi:spore coat protein U-like protein